MKRIQVGTLELTAPHKAAVLEVLNSNQLSPGPKCREFEQAFAKTHRARYGLFVNSGTDALRMGLLALKEKYGWKDGDEVIVPSLTFVATVNVILQAGLKPFFMDVGMYDFAINPLKLEHYISGAGEKSVYRRIRAIMPVHLLGHACDMKSVLRLAKMFDWKVIEDSCEMMGIDVPHGDITCYSTYVCHLMTTGVGGIATTNNKSLSLLMRSYANHGRNTDYLPGLKTKGDIRKRFRFDRLGYSARPTEMEAALGLEELKLLPHYIKSRRKVALLLYAGLCDISEILVRVPGAYDACMMFPVLLRENSKISKWSLCRFLERRGIETREILPLISQPCYRAMKIPDYYPVSSWVNDKGFYIGCHPGITKGDIARITRAFMDFFRGRH